jgi:hypothetical protein
MQTAASIMDDSFQFRMSRSSVLYVIRYQEKMAPRETPLTPRSIGNLQERWWAILAKREEILQAFRAFFTPIGDPERGDNNPALGLTQNEIIDHAIDQIDDHLDDVEIALYLAMTPTFQHRRDGKRKSPQNTAGMDEPAKKKLNFDVA